MASTLCVQSRRIISRILSTRQKQICLNYLSTSEKNNDNSSSNEIKTKYQPVPDFSKPDENRNWVSFGFDYEDKAQDRLIQSSGAFFFVTLIGVFGVLFMYYMPESSYRNWAKREAFIRLHEREHLGLEPIDKNYVDPSKVILPSEEELGDTKIII